ncbi:unnamed protein product [Soboliphyme baturini]|uniref:Secreted protein n=1 Tax=Soboliphyme baturini TaxID=241478 RepID=A0A183INW6_9BILA|nr:unnamed protein product [Soboliphyme baturini]
MDPPQLLPTASRCSALVPLQSPSVWNAWTTGMCGSRVSSCSSAGLRVPINGRRRLPMICSAFGAPAPCFRSTTLQLPPRHLSFCTFRAKTGSYQKETFAFITGAIGSKRT